MDAQTQDAMCVSEKELLTAPPGWTKKLVPASAKSITLRKHDVVFIAPDGQEVKSKWHLSRYLKAHPEGPALSEFSWSSGEEAPIRRSTRFATREVSEDNKNTSRKKGKRNASEMENDPEKTPSRKRAKKAGSSAGLDEKSAVEVAAGVMESDEVMHEAIACDNDAAPCDEVQKDESNDKNFVEVEASKEDVTEKAMDEELDKQAKEAEGPSATIGGEHEHIQVEDEGVGEQAEAEKAIISSASIGRGDEEIQIKVVEVKGSSTDNGLHPENECEAAQETVTLGAPTEEPKVEEVAIETKVQEPGEHLDQKLKEIEDISCKMHVENSAAGEIAENNDKPLELSKQKEEPLEPLMQKEDPIEPLMHKGAQERPMEEQERRTHNQSSPLKVEHVTDKGPSKFSSSPVPVTVVHQ